MTKEADAGNRSITRAELEESRGRAIPDVIGPRPLLLIVGVNPGLRSAVVQAPFARRGNKFYPALYQAGIVDRLIDASGGLDEGDREHLIDRGIGITTLISGASARTDELTSQQLVDGASELAARVRKLKPNIVAMLGITSFRIAFGRPKAIVGPQPGGLEGAGLWVVPNPSGLNAHATVSSLAAAYRQAAIAAGIDVYPRP